MHRTGHYGAALLAYAPLGTAAVAVGATDLAVLGGVGALAGAKLPDLDRRVPGVAHRGPTHTVGFALVVGVLVATVLASALVGARSAGGGGPAADGLVDAGGPVALAAFGGIVATVAVGSHLLADALTPMGVRPFAPLSSRKYALDVATSDNLAANYALLAGGVAAIGTGFWLGRRIAVLLG